MSRSEQITKQLKTLSTTTPDIEAAAVVDNDGLMIASALPGDVEDDRVARELKRGTFSLVMIRGSEGFTILARCGPDAVLTVLTTESAKLGLIFLDVTRAAKEIGRLIA